MSHFAYAFCFDIPLLPFTDSFFNQTSVVWSLAWGLVLLRVSDDPKLSDAAKLLLAVLVCIATLPSDWSCVATMAIVFLGLNRGNFKKQMTYMMTLTVAYAAVYFIFIDKVYGIIQLGTCLTAPILRQYNGKRGDCKFLGRLFYIYYPAHLAVCGVIRLILR